MPAVFEVALSDPLQMCLTLEFVQVHSFKNRSFVVVGSCGSWRLTFPRMLLSHQSLFKHCKRVFTQLPISFRTLLALGMYLPISAPFLLLCGVFLLNLLWLQSTLFAVLTPSPPTLRPTEPSKTIESAKVKKKSGPQKGIKCSDSSCQATFNEKGKYLVKITVGKHTFYFCKLKHFSSVCPPAVQLLL
jgi:hypothetical protein